VKWAATILAAVRRCPGLTTRGLAEETGVRVQIVYTTLQALEYSGEVRRTGDLPAGWMPVEEFDDAQPGEDLGDALDAVGALLTEAMMLPDWSITPPSVKHKVEHAWVELQRSRGGDGAY
jgi:hypothetical protein